MARARRKRQPAGLRKYWAGRRKARKLGRPGHTRRVKRRRKRKASAAPRARRTRRVKRRTGGKRRRSRRVRTHRRRARRTVRSRRTRRTRRARRARARIGRTRHRGRTRAMSAGELKALMGTSTYRFNPGRRRRRKRRGSSRRGRYTRRRRSGRRSFRRYRRNPGGGALLALAKRALPVLGALYGTRLIASRIGPMIPGVSSLGTLQGPIMAVATMFGINFLTKKGPLAKHLGKYREELLLGSALSALDTLVRAFAPASVQSMIGLSDYIQMGDYVAVGGAPPINDSMTLSDYIAVGSDGVEEELGLEEELGVEEDLGNDLMGGMPGGMSLMKPVPSQAFLAPIPARSFTKVIPPAGTSYDNPNQLYAGIFGGGFGR